ncbi:hypothetical protein FD754_001994, partial [Muntiacus muntjak]
SLLRFIFICYILCLYFGYPCRRESCALVNIPAPCVNKMIAHIEDMESKIQEHLKRFETSLEEWNRTSFTEDLKKDLSVATLVKEPKPEELKDEKCPELKQKMETLLSEAIHLIKSLETDRAEAEEALQRQKSRKKRITTQIDSWSIWKLQEIPIAVQNEHEAYLRDIIELRWHFEDKTHQRKHLEEQKEKLAESNAKLKADIDYMIKHHPLLLAKRDHELTSLREYYQKKFEKSTWDIELSNIAKDFSDISIAHSQLVEENKRLSIDIDTVLGYINDSIRKKSELESEIQSLLKMRSKNEEFLKQLYKEAYNISTVFHLTKFKTEELEQKVAEVRRKFKKKLFSLQEEQTLEKQELLRKKAIYSLALGEMEKPLLQLEEEAERIKTYHREHADLLDEVIEKREQVKRNVEKTKKKLRRKGKKTQDAIIKTEDKRSQIFREIETTKSKTVIYHSKIIQLNKNLEQKEKEKAAFDQTLDYLNDQFITLREKKEHAQVVFDHLVNEKKACEERIYEEEQRYRTLFNMRQNTLASIKHLYGMIVISEMPNHFSQRERRMENPQEHFRDTFHTTLD